jgi:hypothetical protein
MSEANRLAQKWISFVLRSEMMKYGVTYAELSKRLVDVGVVEECGALRNRVSRGRFSGAFLFQCLAVIGTKQVNVELCDYIRNAGPKLNEGPTLAGSAAAAHTYHSHQQ